MCDKRLFIIVGWKNYILSLIYWAKVIFYIRYKDDNKMSLLGVITVLAFFHLHYIYCKSSICGKVLALQYFSTYWSLRRKRKYMLSKHWGSKANINQSTKVKHKIYRLMLMLPLLCSHQLSLPARYRTTNSVECTTQPQTVTGKVFPVSLLCLTSVRRHLTTPGELNH